MSEKSFQITLSRKIVFDDSTEFEGQAGLLEIGFSPEALEVGEPAHAAFRIAPVSEWVLVYGEDVIQALELTIRMAEMEAKACGADWFDKDDLPCEP